MGIGVGIGVGATGAGLGAVVGGPVGAAVGGLTGLLVGLFAGGEPESATAGAVESSGLTGSIDPVETQAVPLSGGPSGGGSLSWGPSGGGPLAPPVEASGAGEAPDATPGATQLQPTSAASQASASGGVNLSRQRGNFPATRSFSKVPPRPSNAGRGFPRPAAHTPERTVPPPSSSRPPVETVEKTAEQVAARTSQIPTPTPQQGGARTSGAAIRDAVQKSWSARSATLTGPGAVNRLASGVAGRTRTNAGSTPERPAAPAAQNTSAAPLEALEAVKGAGERMAQNTADRFQGIQGAGRSNVAFKRRP